MSILLPIALCIAAVGVGALGPFQREVSGGVIEGRLDPLYTAAPVNIWKGIPYAAPPVGLNRFAPPQPVSNWTGVLPTKHFSPGCIQTCSLPRPELTCPAQQSEDCLYINVFSPTNATTATLPVLLFIHGGAFVAGASGCPLYESSKLAATQGIVVATFNYRLDLFGALYTGTTLGNYQLQDQRQAMYWVQSNIAAFGGDPTQVTIAGQSAGAMSVGIHLTSPPSAGLYSAALMASNPIGIPYPNVDLATDLGKKVLDALGCPSGGQAELDCLRNQTTDALLVVSNKTKNFPWPNDVLMTALPWLPIVGTPDLPIQPIEAAYSGAFYQVPIVIGSLLNDSVPFIQQASQKPISNLELDVALGYIFGVVDAFEIKELFGAPPNTSDTRLYFAHIGTDYLFTCASRYALQGWASYLYPQNISAYQYVFSHLPSFSTWIWNEYASLCDDAVCHCDDLPFVFDSWYSMQHSSIPDPTPEEAQLLSWMMDFWGTFTRDHSLAALEPAWPQFATTNYTAMDIFASNPTVMVDFQQHYCSYFDSIGYNRR